MMKLFRKLFRKSRYTLTNEERLSIIRCAKDIYEVNPLCKGMCISLTVSLTAHFQQKGIDIDVKLSDIPKYIPEFTSMKMCGKKKRIGEYWWNENLHSPRIRAFLKLERYYSEKINSRKNK